MVIVFKIIKLFILYFTVVAGSMKILGKKQNNDIKNFLNIIEFGNFIIEKIKTEHEK